MSKRKHDNESSVEGLLSLLERGQNLLEQAHQTLQHAERVHAEVATQLAPSSPPPIQAQLPPPQITFPWPPPPADGEADHAARA